MFINGIDIKNFNAKVQKKLIQPSTIDYDIELISSMPLILNKKVKLKAIHVSIRFENSDRDKILNDISNLTSKISECDIKFKNLSHFYHCYLKESETIDTDFDDWLFLSLDFIAFEYSDEVVESLNRVTSKTFNVTGNQLTPAIVEITPSIDLIDLTLTGLGEDPITIKNLKTNKKVIISGEDGTVTEEGVNKFNDSDLWDWPSLKPGTNTITVSKNSCNISIKYKPRYI